MLDDDPPGRCHARGGTVSELRDMTTNASRPIKDQGVRSADAEIRKRFATAPVEGLYPYFECTRCGYDAARRQDVARHDCPEALE